MAFPGGKDAQHQPANLISTMKKSGSSSMCIDPIKTIDVINVPLSSIVDGLTLKVIRVASAISTNAHYNLLLDVEEVGSLLFTYGASPLSSSIKHYLGAKNTIVLGLSIVSLSTALLGFLGNVEDGNKFLNYALLFRFI